MCLCRDRRDRTMILLHEKGATPRRIVTTLDAIKRGDKVERILMRRPCLESLLNNSRLRRSVIMICIIAYTILSLTPNDATSEKERVFKSLQGKWGLESCESEGANLMYPGIKALGLPGIAAYDMIEIIDHEFRVHITLLGKRLSAPVSIKIDASESPSRFECILSKDVTLHGIFALDRNILLIALQTDPKKKTPIRFNSLSDTSTIVMILRKKEATKKEKGKRKNGSEKKGRQCEKERGIT
jgi:uncharacterized protein (TIGR03067 family)